MVLGGPRWDPLVGHVRVNQQNWIPVRVMSPLLIRKVAPYTEGDGDRRQAGHSRSAGGRFKKQRNLPARLVLSGCKASRSPHLPARIFRVHVAALAGFSHVHRPAGLGSTLLSQACVVG